jgi:hypothetical protein
MRTLRLSGDGFETPESVVQWLGAVQSQDYAPASPTVHLLQAYDEYIVGYSESTYVLDVSGAARSLRSNRAVFNSLVTLDGQVAGHWKRTVNKRTVNKDSVVIDAALYAPFDDAQTAALHAAATRNGEFLGLPVAVSV